MNSNDELIALEILKWLERNSNGPYGVKDIRAAVGNHLSDVEIERILRLLQNYSFINGQELWNDYIVYGITSWGLDFLNSKR